jgi:SAM-dependent methyltransferase
LKNNIINKIKRRFSKIPFASLVYKVLKGPWFYILFIIDFYKFKKIIGVDSRFSVRWLDQFPCLLDNTSKTGFDPHYTYHPAWAARIIAENNPILHVDFSSVLHFSTLVSAFVPVDFYDYRPVEISLNNLNTKKADLTAIPFDDNSVESLSCMHTIEHIGLGRYGDPIDQNGDLKAIAELKRVLAPGGNLLFVVPIGKPKIEFNAHRIYSYSQILSYFSDLYLKEFSLIPDNAVDVGIIKNATSEIAESQEYGCGCFWFTKNKY